MPATLFQCGAGSFVRASAAVPFVWQPMTGGQWAGLLLLGSLGTAGHVFLIRSLALAPAALVAPFRYTRLIRVTALGFAVFGDFPGVDTLAGSALIVASGLYVVHREHRG